MGANFLAIVTAVTLQSSPQDTAVYSTPAVQQLVQRAIARRRATDSTVSDYQATIRYRLTVSRSRRRWARVPPIAVEEQVASVQWQLPNDLRVGVLGRRGRSESAVQLSRAFRRPWFAPREPGDSLRIFSDQFPATGALHPLSEHGPDWYRYVSTGDLKVSSAAGVLRLIRLEVAPRRSGPALIVGQVWIDSASAQVVRLAFRYVGTELWVRPGEPAARDTASARRLNSITNRIVRINADLQYSLQRGRYWMPERQVISGDVRLPLVSDLVIPFEARTTFEDYRINTGRQIVFDPPGSLGGGDSTGAARAADEAEPDSSRGWDRAGSWSGGRYQLHRPPYDSLAQFRGWTDSLTLASDPDHDRTLEEQAEIARQAEDLPGALTGQPAHGFGYERLSDLMQYNRVQGLSLGVGYQARIPGLHFTSAYATLRYGLSDERITGRLTVARDAPGGRLGLSGYRDIADLDPFSAGRSFANTFNSLFAGHDNGDYALVQGGSASYETSLHPGLELTVSARIEREGSIGQAAKSAVNDFLGGSGLFPPNPAVRDGTFGRAYLSVSGSGDLFWRVSADALAGEGERTGRIYGDLRWSLGSGRGATVRIKAGLATEPTLPQSLFRLGGLNTVRGFEYGSLRGSALWAAQLDIAPLDGRVRPVVFLDVGQTAPVSDLLSSKALVGGGVGVSFFHGIVRFDLSRPISPDIGGKLRFDIVLRGVR
jgi:hypothetical protein